LLPIRDYLVSYTLSPLKGKILSSAYEHEWWKRLLSLIKALVAERHLT
jgi:hypothetical protein